MVDSRSGFVREGKGVEGREEDVLVERGGCEEEEREEELEGKLVEVGEGWAEAERSIVDCEVGCVIVDGTFSIFEGCKMCKILNFTYEDEKGE